MAPEVPRNDAPKFSSLTHVAVGLTWVIAVGYGIGQLVGFDDGASPQEKAARDIAAASRALTPFETKYADGGRDDQMGYSVPRNPDTPKARKELAQAVGRLDRADSPYGRDAYNLLIRLDEPEPDSAGVLSDIGTVVDKVAKEARHVASKNSGELFVKGVKTIVLAGATTGTLYAGDWGGQKLSKRILENEKLRSRKKPKELRRPPKEPGHHR